MDHGGSKKYEIEENTSEIYTLLQYGVHCIHNRMLMHVLMYIWRGISGGCNYDLLFVAIEIKADVKTAPALLDQFYEKRRLLIVSAPNMSDPDYQLQNIMIQVRLYCPVKLLKPFNK